MKSKRFISRKAREVVTGLEEVLRFLDKGWEVLDELDNDRFIMARVKT